MPGRLEGKVAIVTGASSGIGKASAIQFAKEGAKGIVLVSRTQSKLDDVAKEIAALESSTKCETVVVAGDVGKEETNKKMVDAALEKFGKVDVIFANAGTANAFPIVEATDEQMDVMIDANVKSVVFALKHGLKAMSKNVAVKDSKGSIIATTSVMGSIARGTFAPNMSIYSATKAAVDMLIKHGAIEGAAEHTSAESDNKGKGIVRVNAVAPGIVATDIFGMTVEQVDDFAAPNQLIGRSGRGEEIASFVTFLASDDASFVTGSVHAIDGGWSYKA